MVPRIGITERGDAGLDFEWVRKIGSVDGVIVISKAANDELIRNLMIYRDKVIYHATCTGLGGSVLERNVPIVERKLGHVERLIREGFPISHLVMRIDPLIPIETGNFVLGRSYLEQIEEILKFCERYGIKVRYSYIDMYSYVIDRFELKGIPIDRFSSNDAEIIQGLFRRYRLEYRSCAEMSVPKEHKIGCVSIEDFRLFGLNERECKIGMYRQRSECLCCSAKKELLDNRHPCEHGCLYCYWKS